VRRRKYDTRIDWRHGALRRDVACAFAAIALIVNVLAGALVATRPAKADPTLATILGDPFVICTSTGMIVVDRDGNVLPDPPQGAERHGVNCIFCLPLMQGHAVPPTFDTAIGQRDAARIEQRPVSRESRQPSFKLASNQARAPPMT
jgi:hypothetical protein